MASSYKSSTSFADAKRQFRNELPDDAEFDDVLDLIGTGTFTANQERVVAALAANDWLGFDYPAQAISAVYSRNLSREFDVSDELLSAIDQAGVLYEVEIQDNAVARMLDWDAPLSKQPFIIKEPKEQIIARVKAEGRKPTLIEKASVDVQTKGFGDKSGQVFYNDLVTKTGSPEAASEALEKAGIPGIKYLDQASRNVVITQGFIKPLAALIRGKEKVTRNLVVFDDSIITIKRVDGKPVTAEAFSLGPEGQPVDRKPAPAFEREETELRWSDARK